MLLFDAIQLLRASTCVLGIDRPDLNRRNAVENITQPYLEVWSFQALRPFNYTLQGSLGGSPEQLVRPLSLTSPVSCVDLPPHKRQYWRFTPVCSTLISGSYWQRYWMQPPPRYAADVNYHAPPCLLSMRYAPPLPRYYRWLTMSEVAVS